MFAYMSEAENIQKTRDDQQYGTAEIRFLGRDTVFYGSAVHLNKTIVFAPSLDDSEKSTKLRAHSVNLAFKFRSFVG